MDTTIDILNINIDPYSKSLSVKPGEGSDHLQPSFHKYIKKSFSTAHLTRPYQNKITYLKSELGWAFTDVAGESLAKWARDHDRR